MSDDDINIKILRNLPLSDSLALKPSRFTVILNGAGLVCGDEFLCPGSMVLQTSGLSGAPEGNDLVIATRVKAKIILSI